MAQINHWRPSTAHDGDMPVNPLVLNTEAVYRNGAGEISAVTVSTPEGDGFTVRMSDRMLSWATPDVWAFPNAFGCERYTCPGHNGAVCQYGACDGIRFTGPINV